MANVDNKVLLEKIEAFQADKTDQKFFQMVNELLKSKVYMPIRAQEDKEKKQKMALPLTLKDSEGNQYQPIFTDLDNAPDVTQMPYDNLVAMPFTNVIKTMEIAKGALAGVVINCTTHNVVLKEQLFKSLKTSAEPKLKVMKDGKVVDIDPSTVDPQETVEVKNPEIDALIDALVEAGEGADSRELLTKIMGIRVLMPARLVEGNPLPLAMNIEEGVRVQPVFTDKTKIPANLQFEAILNMPFTAIAQMVMTSADQLTGIMVNPHSRGFILRKEHLKNMVVKPEVAERLDFERGYLPRHFFEDTKAFVSELVDRKEEYIDELFEDSYKNKRMYPYLAEEFKVMVMMISEEAQVFMIDMPTADQEIGVAKVLYLVWNPVKEECRYFVLAKGKSVTNSEGKREEERLMIEIEKDGKNTVVSNPPIETQEIAWIMENCFEE